MTVLDFKLWTKMRDKAKRQMYDKHLKNSRNNAALPAINQMDESTRLLLAQYFRALLMAEFNKVIVQELEWLIEALEYEDVPEDEREDEGSWVEL